MGGTGENRRGVGRDRVPPSRYVWDFGVALLLLASAQVGCEEARHARTVERELTQEPPPLAGGVAKTSAAFSPAFELYSTLPGKMARMEELLNGIDRLLDQPGFRERLVADAKELHQLLIESRGLYPTDLSAHDRPRFDQAIDQTAAESLKLFESIRAEDSKTAREAIVRICEQRQEAHSKYSN